METINVKEQARSLIDRLPEDITWQDLMSESIELPSVQGSRKRVNIMKFLAAILNSERIGKNREIITNYDCDEPLDLLPSSLVNRLLEKAKELTKLSAEIAEIITALDSERATNRKLLAPTPKKQRRPPLFGSDRDVISVSENFDEPLEDFQDYM
jgi:hypothetical protein